MDDKKFSVVVLVLVFVVAVPSMIFLFSGSGAGSTGQVGYPSLHLNPQGLSYAYQKEFKHGPRQGVDVPIYDEKGNLVRYEKRIRTETGSKKRRPTYKQTYVGQKQRDCPQGYRKVSLQKAASYKSMGKIVEKFGEVYCWYPQDY